MNEMNDDHLVTDPVCAMKIRRDKAAATIVHQGKTYFFCAEVCRRQFELEPERYLGGGLT